MRIIAGQRRGHKFDGPKDLSTRPTSDLVREAIFNILSEAVEGLLVVDLFAGTGALGLEALSRGAERVIFVERNRENAALIRRNIATLRFEDRAQVVVADAYRWVKSYQPVEAEPIVVFIDPPYDDYEDHPERIVKLISILVEKLPDGSILSAESRRKLDSEILPEIEAWDVRKYGGTQLAIRILGEIPEPDSREADRLPRIRAMPTNEARRAFATDVVARLRSAGFVSLWAGGCVRDLILGLEPSDYDVATDATPDQVMGLFRRTVPVGASFGVVRVIGPETVGEVEVATFRSDGAYLDGRRPESVTFSSPRLDAERRDFTINGMFLDPIGGEILDYVGGREDLQAGDPSSNRRPRSPVRRGQAPSPPSGPVRGPVRNGDRAEDSSGNRRDGQSGPGRLRRTDRPGIAPDVGPPVAIEGDEPGTRVRPDRADLAASDEGEGSFPGEIGPAQRRSLGSPDAGARPPPRES